jgi:hypothetical protein
MVIDLLMQFGAREKAPGGGCKAFFDKAARRRLERYAGPLATHLQQHLASYIVLAADDQVITVGHRTKRIARN